MKDDIWKIPNLIWKTVLKDGDSLREIELVVEGKDLTINQVSDEHTQYVFLKADSGMSLADAIINTVLDDFTEEKN